MGRLTQLLDWFQQTIQAVLRHKDELEVAATLLAIASVVVGLAVWLRTRLRPRQPSGNDFPFRIFKSPSALADDLFATTTDDPLPDKEIPYISRATRSIDESFRRTGRILIRGKMKSGKTREAFELISRHWEPDTVVLRLRHGSWLDPPFLPPPEADLPHRKLVLLIDEIDYFCRVGYVPPVGSRDDRLEKRLRISFPERLLDTIRYFERLSGAADEVRLVATVRSEAGHWGVLGFDPEKPPWSSMAVFDLADLSDEITATLVAQLVTSTGISASEQLRQEIVRRNEGAFLTVIGAFREWKRMGVSELDEAHIGKFIGETHKYWIQRYRKRVEEIPQARFLYQSMALLKRQGFPLHRDLVLENAARAQPGWRASFTRWGRELFMIILVVLIPLRRFRFIRRRMRSILEPNRVSGSLVLQVPRDLRRTMNELLRVEIPHADNVLRPYDGQAEAFSQETSERPFPEALHQGPTEALSVVVLANALAARGLDEAALRLVDESLQFVDDPNLHILRGTLLRSRGRLEEGLAEMGRALENLDDLVSLSQAMGFHQRAHIYEELGRKDEALADFTRAIELDPTMAEYYFCRSLCLSALGRHEEALVDANYAVELQPDLYRTWQSRGKVYLAAEKWQQALTDFEQVLRLSPGESWAHFHRSVAFEGLGRSDEALSEMNQAIELDPRNASFWERRGTLRHKASQPSAMEDLDKAIELEPDVALFWWQRALIHQEKERDEAALSDLEEAARLRPQDAPIYRQQIESLLRLGRFEEAVAACNRLIELEPTEARAFEQRSRACAGLERLDEALLDIDKAIELAPDAAVFWYQRALIHQEKGRDEAALSDLEEAARLRPQDAPIYRRQIESLFRLHRFEEAVAACSRLIELEPTEAWAFERRSWACVELGRSDEALRDIDRAIELAPDVAPYWWRRALIHQKEGRDEAALSDLEEAARLRPQDAPIFEKRAEVHFSARRFPEAVEDCTKALELDRDSHVLPLRGMASYRMRRYESALEDFDRWLEKEPGAANIRVWRAAALLDLERQEEALAELENAESSIPEDPYLHHWKGATYRDLGRHEETLLELQKALDLGIERVETLMLRAFTFDEMEQPEQALADLDQLLELEPQKVDAFRLRARLRRDLGRLEDALADLDRAIDLKPSDSALLYQRGWIRASLGQAVAATEDASRALALALAAGVGLEKPVEIPCVPIAEVLPEAADLPGAAA